MPDPTILYRPVGPEELALIASSGFTAFPPRRPEQPIFYPVVSRQYAEQIAGEWNAADPATGHQGFVTRFPVDTSYLAHFEEKQVGDATHREYWIPAEELGAFNARITGRIEVIVEFRCRAGVTERIAWRGPWASMARDARAPDGLDAELMREVGPGHALEGRTARAIGRRDDRDDVLYVLDGPGPGYAVVHLTYNRESDPAWPWARLFADASVLERECLAPDARELQTSSDT